MKAVNGYGGITKLSGKRRRPYWVRITIGWEIENGKAKQQFKTLGYYATRKEAALALANYNTSPTDLTKKDITFKEVFEIWGAKHFEKFPSSEKQLRPIFNKYLTKLHDMSMVDIKTVHLQSVLDDVKNMGVSTHHRIKNIMSRNFKYCMENDILQKDYSQFVKIASEAKTEKSENFFTKDEIKKIIAANPDDIILTLLHTGMRIGELFGVKIEHVHLDKRYIEVHGTKTKNANRIVPIHKDIIPIIEKNIQTGKYLFSNSVGNKLDYSSYSKTKFKPFMDSLGLKQTPHATRHTFISLMDGAGVSSNSVTLKRIVGHSNSSVTHHYTHKEINELIEAIDKLKIIEK